MREIKFRAWDTKNKIYIPDFLLYSATVAAEWFEFKAVYYNAFADARYCVEQSTGLLDKNGKEIYEGDIVKINGFHVHECCDKNGFPSLYEKPFAHIKEVKYSPYNGWSITWGDTEPIIEVLGNVHQNHELLNK